MVGVLIISYRLKLRNFSIFPSPPSTRLRSWLQDLGPIIIDYTSLTMSFSLLGRQILLHVDAPFQPSPASAHEVHYLVQTNGVLAMFHLTHIPKPTQSPPPHLSYQPILSNPAPFPLRITIPRAKKITSSTPHLQPHPSPTQCQSS